MTSVQWRDGGHETSKQAGLTRLARIALGVVLLGVLASACDSGNQSASTAASASQAPASQAPASQAPESQAPEQAAAADDCSTQAEREAFIGKQIAQGHWQKVGQVAKVFHVHVTPAFMADTTPDEQQQSLAVVSAFSQCAGGGSRVAIHDATTGEQIGQFSDAGLELKDKNVGSK